jgi:hypothetical protein
MVSSHGGAAAAAVAGENAGVGSVDAGISLVL